MENFILISDLDEEGRGVGRCDGQVCFLENALPGEVVTSFKILKKKKNYWIGVALSVKKPSPNRTTPMCPHFGVCGGCTLQHIDVNAQVAVKQRFLEETLLRIGQTSAQMLLPPIYGLNAGYRFRARMSVKYVEKKGGVLVGFHERSSPFVADMQQCKILPERVSQLIQPLREMIAQLSIRNRLPQIEWAVGAKVIVMAFRIMQMPTAEDEAILRTFVDAHQDEHLPLQLWFQPGKEDSLHPFYPIDLPCLSYQLSEFSLEMPFHPTEFTQVNPYVNEVMVSRAMQLLKPQSGEKIVDFFCGLGNFSLPIARCGAQVLGVEGSEYLVQRATMNAKLNGLGERCCFQTTNLFDEKQINMALWAGYDKWLIDPPRDGAQVLVQSINPQRKPQKIIYISCKPATLARDAQILKEKGYRLTHAGVMNMFPHTAHVESIAVFEG